MKNFEENLNRLEEIATSIRKSDVSLEDAVKYFEEGINLARRLEKDLDKIENKVQILMNHPQSEDEKPELSLFDF